MEEFLKVLSVITLHHNCTEYRDLLAERAVKLVEDELRESGRGTPPVPYALLSTGSDGRDEQTLITDQDHLIVYGDEGGDDADVWFTDFSLLLVDRLEEIGFAKCTGDMMPSNPTWRGSYQQWRRRLTSIVRACAGRRLTIATSGLTPLGRDIGEFVRRVVDGDLDLDAWCRETDPDALRS